MLQRFALCALVAAATFLSGCQQDAERSGQGTAPGAQAIRTVALTPVDHVAWLSRELPAETIGYFRMPLFWDLLFEPRSDALNNVKASAAHQRQLAAIRQGLLDNLWSELPEPAAAPVKLLLNHITSPLEVAATLPPDGSLVPNFLFGASLRLPEGQSFAGLLDELLALHPQLRRLSPEDDAGVSTILTGPLPAYVHYDSGQARLRIFTGASANLNYFRELLDDGPTDNPVATWEAARDATGRGLSLWVDIARLWPQLEPLLPPETQAIVPALGVDQMQSLHAANLAKDGHGQLRLELNMPRQGIRVLLPNPAAPVDLKSVGAPELFVRLALPTEAEFAEALALIRSLVPEKVTFDNAVTQLHTLVTSKLGHDPALFLKALGPQHLLVADQAGTWSATQIKDSAARDEMLAAWAKMGETEIEARQINGRDYHYVPISGDLFMPDGDDPTLGGAAGQVIDILTRLNSHVFWTDQPGRMVMAAVPQVLVARDELKPGLDLGPWLEEAVGVDPEHSVFLLAARSQKGAREIYHFYLQLLLALADLAEVEIDPFELPVWQDVRQSGPGGVAFGIDATDDALSAHVTYQGSVVEALGGTQAFIAAYVAGIVAAIAIPAYQDYQVRAEVSGVLAEMAVARIAVAENLAASGQLPAALDASALGSNANGVALSYDRETGTIIAAFDATATGDLKETTLELRPTLEGGQVMSWACSSETIPPRLLPGSCRAE